MIAATILLLLKDGLTPIAQWRTVIGGLRSAALNDDDLLRVIPYCN
jgi:hypothetical protein